MKLKSGLKSRSSILFLYTFVGRISFYEQIRGIVHAQKSSFKRRPLPPHAHLLPSVIIQHVKRSVSFAPMMPCNASPMSRKIKLNARYANIVDSSKHRTTLDKSQASCPGQSYRPGSLLPNPNHRSLQLDHNDR
jgi:hypothetical protein